MKIFLAGQVTGEWQKTVQDTIYTTFTNINALGKPRFLVPTADLSTPALYTAYDLGLLEEADVIVGYMEDDNPSGYGLAFELGWGVGRGTPTILLQAMEDERTGYWAYIENAVDLVVPAQHKILGASREVGTYLCLNYDSICGRNRIRLATFPDEKLVKKLKD